MRVRTRNCDEIAMTMAGLMPHRRSVNRRGSVPVAMIGRGQDEWAKRPSSTSCLGNQSAAADRVITGSGRLARFVYLRTSPASMQTTRPTWLRGFTRIRH